jgi:hypothetical protein
MQGFHMRHGRPLKASAELVHVCGKRSEKDIPLVSSVGSFW